MPKNLDQLIKKLPQNKRVKAAINKAVINHGQQLRKDKSELYVFHPLRVALMINNETHNDTLVVASLLHDLIEDTPYTKSQMTKDFGEEVTHIVCNLTEENREESWQKRKAKSINKLRTADKNTLLIKCADKVDNMQSTLRYMQTSNEDPWQIFNGSKTDKIKNWHLVEDIFANRIGNTNLFQQYQHTLAKLLKQ